MTIKMDASLFMVGAGALAAWYLYGKRQAIANALNPTSQTNIAYQSANAVTQSLTGSKTATLGTWLYDVLNPTSSSGSTTALPPGSPGWWASQGLPVPPGVTSNPATWTTLNPSTMPIGG